MARKKAALFFRKVNMRQDWLWSLATPAPPKPNLFEASQYLSAGTETAFWALTAKYCDAIRCLAQFQPFVNLFLLKVEGTHSKAAK